jgi:hypothetical protein
VSFVNLQVVLIGHHVVGNSDYIIREALWFEQLTTSYSDIIVLQVAGHTHTDEFRLVRIYIQSTRQREEICCQMAHKPTIDKPVNMLLKLSLHKCSQCN